jgi:broad specificity phosphatase PhoE
MASSIVLVRHGETAWSASGQHTGRTDIELTAAGRAGARLLAPVLSSHPFDLVLVSPLRRAVDTATLAGLDDGSHKVEQDADLMEWDYGEVEGITTADYRRRHPGWLIWDDGCPGGETVEQVGHRAERVLARCAETAGEVALVAHGHLLRILTARWLGLPANDGRLFALDPATTSTLGYEHETPVIRAWNVPPPPPAS